MIVLDNEIAPMEKETRFKKTSPQKNAVVETNIEITEFTDSDAEISNTQEITFLLDESTVKYIQS